MAEYINRETLLSEIDENFSKTDSDGEEQVGFLKCRRIIREHQTADVAPRADVAREIVEDVKTTLLDYHLQENMKYLQSLFNTKKQFDIKTQRYRAATDAIKFALKTLDEIEKKYAEDGK